MTRSKVAAARFMWVVLVAALLQTNCASNPRESARPTAGVSSPSHLTGEQPISPEKNPAGDIPDTQAFVPYKSPAGFQIDAPEGWSQTSQAAGVTFINNFNGERVTIGRKGSDAAAQVLTSSHAVRDVRRDLQTLPAGPAVHLSFTSNSEPNAVTGKRVRLTNVVFVFGRASATATLWLWAPAGSDNADQWARIARSFRWR